MSKIFYKVDITTTSPLSIGNGEDQYTDNDVLTDDDGTPYIPGTTVAGVISSTLDDGIRNELFSSGKSVSDEDRKMSRVFTYDAYCKNRAVITTRDNVALNENRQKIDGAKFDYQIIENGASFTLLFELTQLNENQVEAFEGIIRKMAEGHVAFGHKTTRGYGRFHVDSVSRKVFNSSNLEEYLSFDVFKWTGDEYTGYLKSEIKEDYDEIHVQIKQNGTLCIRKYNPNPMGPDSMSIQNQNQFCVPGTSWSGAFRSYMASLLKDLVNRKEFTYQKAIEVLENSFYGYARKDECRKSSIQFSETILDHAKALNIDRVKIDRFMGGAVDTAKFDELVAVGGCGELIIRIRSDVPEKKVLDALLLLAIEDLDQGYITIGGESSVGRGMFNVTNLSEIRNRIDVGACKQELRRFVKELREAK